MDHRPPFLRRILPAAAGLFALWQMAFLVAANVIDFVPRGTPQPDGPALDPIQAFGTYTTFQPLQKLTDAVGDTLDAYSELTGQEQTWPLFAPGFPPHSTFSAVELRYADGRRVELLSEFEPADYNRAPIRMPFFKVRRYNLEYQFIPAFLQHTEGITLDPGADGDFVRDQTLNYFRHAQPVLLRWMQWRTAEYGRANSGSGTPAEVDYVARYVPTPLPGRPKVWDGLVRVRPIARWFPNRPTPADELPLQIFDARAGQWRTLLKGGGER